jgi:hypothetical protein
MKLAAHITFYYNEDRLKYLKKVVESLKTIKESVDIYIYTNRKIEDITADGIYVLQYPYQKQKWINLLSIFDFQIFRPITYPLSRALSHWIFYGFKKLGLGKYIHPFYLTWENRAIIEEKKNEYDVQIYLEDDMAFDSNNFEYWVKYSELCITNGYNLGFLRNEVDGSGNTFITDLDFIPKKIIDIEGMPFLLNDVNAYCGLWIYSKEELSRFIQTKEWRFNFRGQNVREKSAIGWHSKDMKHYKATVIPLIEDEEERSVDLGSGVGHLPNNYIGDPVFCKVPYPIRFKK